jgi:hypothetical protein
MTTRPEVEWDDDTRALALGLAAFEDTLCPACGRPTSVCQNPDNDGRFAVRDPIRCHVTTALSMRLHADRDKKQLAPDALLYNVELIGGTDGR